MGEDSEQKGEDHASWLTIEAIPSGKMGKRGSRVP